MVRTWRQQTVLFGLSLLGALAPLAQFLHVVEEHGSQDVGSEVRYVLQSEVWIASQKTNALSTEKTEPTEKSEDSKTSKSQPRIIKLLSEHWDVVGSIEFQFWDVPVLPNFFATELFSKVEKSSSECLPYISQSAPHPVGRGPPAV